jgi:VWFA-related protein
MGRTGLPGSVRIVAQIRTVPGRALQPVRFYVDGVLRGTDEDGPPYAIEWEDENPFEPREITVEAEDVLGRTGRDTVRLEPFEFIDAAQVTSVLLEASVQDERGRFVSDMTEAGFILLENGIRQVPDVVRQEDVPAIFTLLIDSSQSMARRIDFVQHAAARLLAYVRPQDRILVVPFTRELQAVTGPTDDRATILEAIAAIQPRGGTAIADCLVGVARLLEGTEGRRVVVLITDGYDEHSEHSADDSLAAIKAAGVTTYVVGIGGVAGISLRGERFLKRLAEETGGRAYFPAREDQVPAVYDSLAADAQNRYVITYTPANQEHDGAWRSISLTTVDPDLVVRTRPGYFAPNPPPVRPSLEFTVRNSNGEYVDISADELMVMEDGVEQTIDTFHEAVMPVSIVLALDASGSMRRVVEEVKAAARSFIEVVRPEDSLGIMLFADRAELVHDLSSDRETSLAAVEQYEARGGTALYDAIGESLLRLKRVEGRRVVVVLTDGRDEDNPGTAPGSIRTRDEVLTEVRQSGTTVFGIGLGSQVDTEPLEQFAGVSGGETYFPSDVAALETEYRRIVENLRRRYVIGYTSTNTKRDGQWREVQIVARSSGIVITSAGGYFAPER